jgi:hypothetical protein
MVKLKTVNTKTRVFVLEMNLFSKLIQDLIVGYERLLKTNKVFQDEKDRYSLSISVAASLCPQPSKEGGSVIPFKVALEKEITQLMKYHGESENSSVDKIMEELDTSLSNFIRETAPTLSINKGSVEFFLNLNKLLDKIELRYLKNSKKRLYGVFEEDEIKYSNEIMDELKDLFEKRGKESSSVSIVINKICEKINEGKPKEGFSQILKKVRLDYIEEKISLPTPTKELVEKIVQIR